MQRTLPQELVTITEFYSVIQFNLTNFYWAFSVCQVLKMLRKKGPQETYLQVWGKAGTEKSVINCCRCFGRFLDKVSDVCQWLWALLSVNLITWNKLHTESYLSYMLDPMILLLCAIDFRSQREATGNGHEKWKYKGWMQRVHLWNFCNVEKSMSL